MAHTQLNTFHLFAGAGGGILADILLGHNPIGAAEIEEYPRKVLLQRQRDGHLPKFPIWDDVCTLDGRPWRGSVDVLCGGFPCQDISAAGKGAGIAGARSGLWKEYARLIGEMRPRFVFAENSPLLRTRGLGVVLEDLAALGYDARWCVLGAGHVGAPHKRDRMWVLAYAKCKQDNRERRFSKCGRNALGWAEQATLSEDRKAGADGSNGQGEAHLAYAMHSGLQGGERARGSNPQGRKKPDGSTTECGGLWWHTDPAEMGDTSMLHAQGCADGSGQGQLGRASERKRESQENGTTQPIVGRVANGVAHRVDRLKAIGNGQVPQCAAMAWDILSEGLI